MGRCGLILHDVANTPLVVNDLSAERFVRWAAVITVPLRSERLQPLQGLLEKK